MRLAVTAASGDVVRFEVHAKPRNSRPGLGPIRDGILEVKLAAAPVHDAANAELVKRIAKVLGVPRKQVRIVRGEHSRRKLVEVLGARPAALEAIASGEPI